MRLKGEAARPCGPRGRGGDCQLTLRCPRSWVVSCPRACSLPARHPGSTRNQNRASGEHRLRARQPGLSPPVAKAITATVGTGKRAQRGRTAGPCLSKKPRPDATSASQVPLLPAKAFGCLLIVLGLRPPPHQVWETWLPVSSLSSEAPPTAEPPKDGHSPRSSCSDQGKSRQARLPNGACWAVSWRGL